MSPTTQWVMTADPALLPSPGHPSPGQGASVFRDSLFSPRFIGLQFFFKTGSLACFALILAILRQQEKEEGTKATMSSPGLQQQLLVSGPKKEPEESRV